ncbi:Non-specific lipid transfer protein GPI-anchored 2 [Hibiscus syriacus]|uniref:Non-specific lipid transfer protein GPI-anchored 2 n=1 Tax=Hibiscus syriacus TaxID=106335 RepID=A0A6A3CVF9_HIBSY|nr:non-specific lipid transfer protein GPI-anchored 2-like [Hibiscus syriacus]KAE8733096.1 Non-specific lipid transfer protein GPI-anchored 2 [Hibiscus syriacus]
MAAKQTVAIIAFTFFALTFCRGATGQAAAPEPAAVALGPSAEAPASDCFNALLNLSDCLTFVEAGSNLTKPDKACCPELAGLVESSPQCLCKLLDNKTASGIGINIDMKKALDLPTVCRVSTPPVSLCSVINGTPVGAPAISPGGGSPPNGVSKVIPLAIAIPLLPTLFLL